MVFWKSHRQKNSRDPATAAGAKASIERIVQDYGVVLEQREGSIRPTTALPYPKAAIDAALLTAMKLTPPGVSREQLKGGFLFLADFQELTPEERAAVARSDAAFGDYSVNFQEAATKVLNELADVTGIVAPLREKVARETEARAARLRAEGIT